MQMRSRKQRQGRRSRSRRSLKGGAGPYTYEDVSLSVGNSLIQIAVTKEDNGTYSFNVPGTTEPFKNYCKLFQYYQENVPLACVKPSFTNSAEKQVAMPSLVQILGLALILLNINATTVFRYSIKLATIGRCITALYGTVNEPLFTATSDGCVVSESFKERLTAAFKKEEVQVPPFSFYNVNNLSDQEVETILRYFKMAMFYYKFNVLPEQHLDQLSFNEILMDDPKSMEKFVLDKTIIKANIAGNAFQLYKKMFYTQENLSAPAPVASSAPAPVASSASAPVASSAPVEGKSIDERLAALEREVAILKKQIGP